MKSIRRKVGINIRLRTSRPISTKARAVQQTCTGRAFTRSGEVYSGIRGSDLVVEVPAVIPDTADILWPVILSIRGEECESIARGHLETYRARVVNGLDHRQVVRIVVCIVHRPEI